LYLRTSQLQEGALDMPQEQSSQPEETAIESNSPNGMSASLLDNLPQTSKRSNQMILIGSPGWVQRIIHLMHVARITEVRDWSRLMPTRQPNEVISLMQRPKAED
jgi:hypothetical protein